MSKVAVIHTAFEDSPRTVALVDVGILTGDQALEYAYRWTNNVMGSWSIKEKMLGDQKNGDFNPNVEVLGELPVVDGKTYGMRSTSMGDQMLIGTRKYKVAMMGFEELA